MLRIKFNDGNFSCNAEFSQKDGIVQLLGKVPKNTSGFKVFRLNGNFLGDYSDYTEIVAELENGLRFGKQK